MHVEVVHSGGRYAERVLKYLNSRSPESVTGYQVPSGLPPTLEDAQEFLPEELGGGDIILAINLHPEMLLEIPYLVAGGSARALIAPLEDPGWVRPGLQRQVTQACAQQELESAFPKPFCSLEPVTPAITEFSGIYKVGRPRLVMRLQGGKIAAVELVRGSPCGLTEFVAKELVGWTPPEGKPAVEALRDFAGQLHHSYPCFASMNLDPETGETVMHKSLYLLRDEAVRAWEEATRR